VNTHPDKEGAHQNPEGIIADDRDFDKDCQDCNDSNRERGHASKAHLPPNRSAKSPASDSTRRSRIRTPSGSLEGIKRSSPGGYSPPGRAGAEGEEMTEQEELIQDIRERLGEMPKRALPFDLLAFATTIGERYSMTQNEIIRLVMQEADALGVNYLIGSRSR
jgi:hypothetical protein